MDCVLVHGWMVTSKVWDDFAPRLGARTFTPSTVPAASEISSATLATLATRVLEDAARAGFERFHLVGHSMGGQLAQIIAATAKDRVRSLALVNPVPLGGLPLPPDVGDAFRTSGGNRAAQGGILDQACRELSPVAKDALLADAGTVPAAWIARALDLFVAGGDTAVLGSIACPTLVVATSDPFLPPAFLEQAVVSKISGARLAVLEGPGHYPQIERPGELAALLRAFFAEHPA
jgi:non-heme chloroperoxidase